VLEKPEAHVAAYQALTGNTAGGNTIFMAANNRTYYLQGVQSHFSYHFKTGHVSNEALLGIRFHNDQADRFQWTDNYEMRNHALYLTAKGEPGTSTNRVSRAYAWAAFLRHKLQYKNLTLTPGLRLEAIDSQSKDYGDPPRTKISTAQSNRVAVWIPGIGASYNISRSLNVFGGVHRGFSPPGFRSHANPEKSVNYELGGRLLQKKLTLDAVGFYTHYSNMLGADLAAVGGTGSGRLYDAGRVASQGAEFQLNYQLPFQLFSVFFPVGISYTYTDARFLDTFSSKFEEWGKVNKGDLLPYLAPNQLTLSAGLEHRFFNFNFNVRYMDAMRTVPGRGFPKEYSTDSYFTLDAAANAKIHTHADLFCSVSNASNQVYNAARRPMGLRPGMPRTFILGVKVNF
ncbi:MAG: TonB-dependent receptor, partial [Candidatus Nephrothrix sp. EaCA]